jgi:hypothetical protein
MLFNVRHCCELNNLAMTENVDSYRQFKYEPMPSNAAAADFNYLTRNTRRTAADKLASAQLSYRLYV